jgi:hypothetical protein
VCRRMHGARMGCDGACMVHVDEIPPLPGAFCYPGKYLGDYKPFINGGMGGREGGKPAATLAHSNHPGPAADMTLHLGPCHVPVQAEAEARGAGLLLLLLLLMMMKMKMMCHSPRGP